jgi:hypothetical protein
MNKCDACDSAARCRNMGITFKEGRNQCLHWEALMEEARSDAVVILEETEATEAFYVNPGSECFGKGKHHTGPCPGHACPYLNDCVMEYEAGPAVILENENLENFHREFHSEERHG